MYSCYLKKKEIEFGLSYGRNVRSLVRVHNANPSGALLCSCMDFTTPAVPTLTSREAGFKDSQPFWGLARGTVLFRIQAIHKPV